MENNTNDIFHATYCLMNIVTLEAGDKDVLVDIIHFCFEIQVNRNFPKNFNESPVFCSRN